MNIFQTRDDLVESLPKNMVIAELGVFLGEFSEVLYRQTSPKKLFLVDLFKGKIGSGDKDGKNFRFINLDESFKNLQTWAKDKNIEIVQNDTTAFLDSLKDDFLDMVYIDADHSYNAVKNDLLKSYRVVKKNGFICGHDYCPKQFPDVVLAVDEFCKQFSLRIESVSQDGCPTYLIKKI